MTTKLFIVLLIFASPALNAQEPAAEIASGRQSNGALTLFKEGVELSQKGDYQEAIARFSRACLLSPNWALPYVELAVAHMMTDNDKDAIGKALAQAVKLGKDIPRAHYLYGVFLQEAGNRSEAIMELTQALQLRPSLVDARYRLATIYVEEGRQSEGIQQYEYVLVSKGSHVGAHRDLAVLYEQSGQLEKAEAQWKAIADLFPAGAIHWTNLAKFYERIGWKDKARAAFQKAERLEPTKDQRQLRPLLRSGR